MGFVDLANPKWFPANYRALSDEFRMIRLDIQTIGQASFLDKRMQTSACSEIFCRIDSAQSAAAPSFLFHTAFCGSTLLARALHSPLAAVSLKEPSVLLDLSAASLSAPSNGTRALLDRRLATAMTLLSRPWTAGGRVLIKPTNQVNRLILEMLGIQSKSRGVLLYSSLEEFVISCFKKLPLSETRVRWMAQHLLADSELSVRLDIPPLHPFTLPESCVFAWYAQMERYAKALDADDSDRLRTLDMATMLASPLETVRAAALWLDLGFCPDSFERQVAAVFERDSKATGVQYNSSNRALEKKAVVEKFGDVIARTLRWAQSSIHPHAMLPTGWKPLSS